jgi:hypothetical protein
MGLLTEGWQKRLAVPIQPTDEALTNFSVVLTEAMMPSGVTDVLFDVTEGALTSGGDLRVSVDLDGDILVGVDLRRWNKAAGEVEIAFRVPQTSAVLTTTLYLWWGKTGASQPATGGVGGQHSAYDDDTIFCAPVGGGANRTAFNITGTDVGGITAGDIAAPSALLGTQHTDVGDYSTYGDNPDLDLVNTDWTMSFLFRATTSGQEQYILGKYDHTTQNRGYLCIFSAAQHFDLTYQPVRTSYNPIYRLSSGVDVVDGQWHHLAGTFISGTRASVYTDGILRNTTTNNIPSSVASNGAPFQIGTQVASQNRPADFSHVTVHSVARSAEWLKAENDNFRAPAAFFGTFSAPEDMAVDLELTLTLVDASPSFPSLVVAVQSADQVELTTISGEPSFPPLDVAKEADLPLSLQPITARPQFPAIGVSIGAGQSVDVQLITARPQFFDIEVLAEADQSVGVQASLVRPAFPALAVLSQSPAILALELVQAKPEFFSIDVAAPELNRIDLQRLAARPAFPSLSVIKEPSKEIGIGLLLARPSFLALELVSEDSGELALFPISALPEFPLLDVSNTEGLELSLSRITLRPSFSAIAVIGEGFDVEGVTLRFHLRDTTQLRMKLRN